MNVNIDAMRVSSFGCRFSVLAAPSHPEMFMMNMQVYDVLPHPVVPSDGDYSATPGDALRPVSVVWCAVFNVKGVRHA